MLINCRDWKKLTFYYFADAYINFNSLVTDLFKIYKTRIWMSAINPASFASPTLGIQAPSGVGPGAVGAGRNASNTERRQNHQSQNHQAPNPSTQAYTSVNQAGRGYRPAFNDPFGGGGGEERAAGPPISAYPASGYGYVQPNPFGAQRGNMPFAVGINTNADAYSGYNTQPGDYSFPRHRFPTPGSVPSPGPHAHGLSPVNSQQDWTGAFQSLSLNGN